MGILMVTELVQDLTQVVGQHLHKYSTTITKELLDPSWPLSQEA